MAKKPVLSDVQAVSFKGVDFDAQIVEWTDSRKPRLALHEYLKRDGAEAEYMGRQPHRVRFNAVYIGASWRKDFLRLQATVDEYPIGQLVHPFFGSMHAACEGIDGAKVSIESGIDTITVPISFVESNLDQKLSSEDQQKGVSSKEGQVTATTANLSLVTTIYTSATGAITTLNTAATSYATDAVASTLSTGSPDASLPQQLAAVVTAASDARDAIRLDPAADDDAARFEAVSAIELVLDACAQLDEAMRSSRPVLAPYIVPSTVSLLSIAQAYYGPDASGRLDEIRTNNPGKIPNPGAVRSGTTLDLAPKTIRRPEF